MVHTAISIITALGALLLIGLLVSLFAQRLKIPEALLLIIAGMGLGYLQINGEPVISFPELFLTTTALLALALILFGSSTKIKLRSLDVFAIKALRLTFVFIFLEMVFVGLASYLLLGFPIPVALFFAAMVAGSSSDVMTTIFAGMRHKVVEILKFESIFNTPIIVIIPFIIIDFLKPAPTVVPGILTAVEPLLIKVVAGVGSGAILFVLLYKVISQKYSKVYTPLSVLVSAILAFVLAENIGGDGVLSVTTLGLLFGNFIKKKKQDILKIESIFSKALYVLVFVLIGMIIKIPTSLDFFINSLLLFGAFLVIRFIVCLLTLVGENLSLREKIFASLQSAKGIATATLVLTFAVASVGAVMSQHLQSILDLTMLFILYSLILSTITIRLSSKFLNHEKNTS